MFRSDRENSSEVEVVKMYDVPEIDGGIFDDIDFANAGESDQAESSSFALTDELPEKLRRDSQDTNFSKIAPRRSRGISDAFEAPDAFSFDESPHERSSRASGVSRFTSFGGLENDSVSRSLEFESQTLGFGENALREEPQSMTQYSQMPMSQVAELLLIRFIGAFDVFCMSRECRNSVLTSLRRFLLICPMKILSCPLGPS
mmetsp:Transcript_10498/g.24010  ORF Transcript_10498/g.24010 Transcript_10498/m.24010 type:complete len:202 (-) Transcript_10498:2733-3338(-)